MKIPIIFFRRKCYLLILIIILIVITPIYFYIPIITPPKYVSPDEVVNYYFCNLYANRGNLYYADDINNISAGAVRPRGTIYLNGKIITAKFLGFPLILGTFSIVIPELVRFITGLFALFNIIMIYYFIYDLMKDQKISFVISALITVSSIYIYWVNLSMFENIFGCSLFIFHFRYLIKFLINKDLSYGILSGLFLGLAMSVRLDYVFIILPISIGTLLIYFKFSIKKILQYKTQIIISCFIFFLAIFPILLLNKQLYGGFLTSSRAYILDNNKKNFFSYFYDFFTIDNFNNFFENISNIITIINPINIIIFIIGIICVLKNVFVV